VEELRQALLEFKRMFHFKVLKNIL